MTPSLDSAVSAAAALAAWEEKTFAFLDRMGFSPRGATVIAAVSGGADSLALLAFWAGPGARRYGCRVRAVHVHHGLRAAADLDQALVEERCRDSGVPLRVFRLDPAARRKGESVEMWARRERYVRFQAALDEARREAAAPAPAAAHATSAVPSADVFLLTAHHRGDLVETVLQRLGRGTGARGLAGIPFRRAPGIVRPFLDRPRADIEAYLRLRGLPWREDESNLDLRIDRNRYRHHVVPALRAREPDLDARVLSLALAVQSLGEGLAALEEDAGLLGRDEDGRPRLAAAAVERLLDAGADQSLRHWLSRLGEASGSPAPVTEEILRELHRQRARAAGSGTRRLRVQVAPGLALERRKNGYYWETAAHGPRPKAVKERSKKGCPPAAQRIILDNGTGSHAFAWGGRTWRLSVRVHPRPAGLVFPAAAEDRAIFDADLISCRLLLRTRKAGDRFSPHGVRSATRKLKVFMNEKRIPAGDRDDIPLVFAGPLDGGAGEGILAWVPGHGISEFLKVGDSTSRILEMELTCLNP